MTIRPARVNCRLTRFFFCRALIKVMRSFESCPTKSSLYHSAPRRHVLPQDPDGTCSSVTKPNGADVFDPSTESSSFVFCLCFCNSAGDACRVNPQEKSSARVESFGTCRWCRTRRFKKPLSQKSFILNPFLFQLPLASTDQVRLWKISS